MDLIVAIVVILVVFALAAFGGHVSAKGSMQKKIFWGLGFIGVIATTVQTVRQQNAQARFESETKNLLETSLNSVTGGDSFCFIRLQVGQDGIYPVVLSAGRYPVYDLTMRLWDPEEWKSPRSLHDGLAKLASETSQLGTLASKDYKNIGEIPIPTGDKTYAAQFSARNGTWSQTLVVRQTPNGWKVASIVRTSRKGRKIRSRTKQTTNTLLLR